MGCMECQKCGWIGNKNECPVCGGPCYFDEPICEEEENGEESFEEKAQEEEISD